MSGVPITSTSANLSGGPNPVSADEVAANFGDQLDMLVDGGPATSRIPSTVIDVSVDPPILIREEIISKQQIENIIGEIIHER